MRRTTFHRTSLAAASLLLLAACGSQSGSGDKGGGAVSPKPTPTPTSSPSPSVSGPAAGCTPLTSELTAADSGRTFCLAQGGTVRVTLTGSEQRPWKKITEAGDTAALTETNYGIMLRGGDAGSAYRATAAGTVTLSSTRPLCAQPTAPGGVSCKGIQEWRVTVKVS
jgi:putative hemolysin